MIDDKMSWYIIIYDSEESQLISYNHKSHIFLDGRISLGYVFDAFQWIGKFINKRSRFCLKI